MPERDWVDQQFDNPEFVKAVREESIANFRRAEALEVEADHLRAERDALLFEVVGREETRAERSLEHSRQWWATRFEQLTTWARRELPNGRLRDEFFHIVTNAFVFSSGPRRPPRFAALYNAQRNRANVAERDLRRARRRTVAALMVAEGMARGADWQQANAHRYLGWALDGVKRIRALEARLDALSPDDKVLNPEPKEPGELEALGKALFDAAAVLQKLENEEGGEPDTWGEVNEVVARLRAEGVTP